MAFEKISAAQADHVMIKAAAALRSLKSENEQLRAEIAGFQRREHAEKIANAAVDRGIMDVDEAEDYASSLASGNEDLRMVEDFVNRAAAGVPLGKTLEKTASDNLEEGGETDVLTAFLLSSQFAG